jgi:nucleotide-binding universal stress UspA family protein
MLVICCHSRYNLFMYKRILAAVNEFTNSEVAARYAIALAKSCRAMLSFIFIAEKTMGKEVFRHAEGALERLFIEAEKQDIEVESITERGDPFGKVREVANQQKIDLVFIATRREDIQKRFFLRTLSREFMMKLPCSVAMVRVVRMGKVIPKNILVPVRGRMTHIEERSCFVAKLAETFGSKVTLFHLAEPLTRYFHGEVHLSSSQREERIPKDVERITECLGRYQIHHEKRTRYGSIAREITIEAAYKRNDLIVMGASERGLVRSFIGENPVETVLRETPCNLIVFRPGRT